MELIFTKRFLKQLNKLKNKRSIDDTDEVLDTMRGASNIVELRDKLDIKKYEIDDSYRVRYSGKPEMRIRFLLDKKQKDNQKIELQLVMTREDYSKFDNKSIQEEGYKQVVVLLTENQLDYLNRYIESNSI